MSTEEHIQVEGMISAILPSTTYRVKLENEHEVLAYPAGLMRKRHVRLTIGDRVVLELSQYDLSKARIIRRLA